VEKIMKNTLTILTEAEQIGVSIAQIEGENTSATRKVEDIEKALSEAVSAQQAVQDRLSKEKAGFEQFLTTLPDTLPAEKVRKITQDRVTQLIEAGLLDGVDASSVEAEAPASMKEAPKTSEPTQADTTAAEEEPQAADPVVDEVQATVEDQATEGEDLLAIDMASIDDEQQPSPSTDEIVALVDKEKPGAKRGQAKVDTPEFVEA
jgi:hypothetical protein